MTLSPLLHDERNAYDDGGFLLFFKGHHIEIQKDGVLYLFCQQRQASLLTPGLAVSVLKFAPRRAGAVDGVTMKRPCIDVSSNSGSENK